MPPFLLCCRLETNVRCIAKSEGAFFVLNSVPVSTASADAIVVGKPVSVFQQKQYGVVSSVEVLSTLKGKEYRHIKLYQLGKVDEMLQPAGDVLDFNQTYILFLGSRRMGNRTPIMSERGCKGLSCKAQTENSSTRI
ncbi:hypothetical protein [Cohnella boryungensis]|uniref:MacB-like periplasmic core domain-containing protein n=1 Tax=Cohnella boryungensis TaxID=768479 RepID=A0ABV8SII4_9BACL